MLGPPVLAPSNLVDTIPFPQVVQPNEMYQAWQEKLTLNFIIWFICTCAVFVITILGLVICPTEHVFSPSELALYSYSNLVY